MWVYVCLQTPPFETLTNSGDADAILFGQISQAFSTAVLPVELLVINVLLYSADVYTYSSEYI